MNDQRSLLPRRRYQNVAQPLRNAAASPAAQHETARWIIQPAATPSSAALRPIPRTPCRSAAANTWHGRCVARQTGHGSTPGPRMTRSRDDLGNQPASSSVLGRAGSPDHPGPIPVMDLALGGLWPISASGVWACSRSRPANGHQLIPHGQGPRVVGAPGRGGGSPSPLCGPPGAGPRGRGEMAWAPVEVAGAESRSWSPWVGKRATGPGRSCVLGPVRLGRSWEEVCSM